MFHHNQNRMVRETVAAPVQSLPRSAEERRDMLLQDRSFHDRGRPCVRVVQEHYMPEGAVKANVRDAVELFRYGPDGFPLAGTILS